jgi:hypothetical protein
MTSHIDPVQPPGGSASSNRTGSASSNRTGSASSNRTGSASSNRTVRGACPLSGDFSAEPVRARAARPTRSDPALEDGPTAEVRAAMAAASRTLDSLAASGRELQFNETHGGRVEVALHRVSGERIAVLQLSDLYTLLEQEGNE